MSDSERCFIGGIPNPEKLGFFSLRWSSGEDPDPTAIAAAAAILGREEFVVDDRGYQCEIIGAAVAPDSKRVAYVESRAKDKGRKVDISIKVHLHEPDGKHLKKDIESYNPFFGCDVRFFKWFDSAVVLIYREKHWTFACRFGDLWPPRFVKIEDSWVIKEGILNYIGYKENTLKRLAVPTLEELAPMSRREAAAIGVLPPEE